MKKDEPPVVVEQTFKAPIETVWKAITELDQMVQWYFDNIPAFKPEVGFETQFNVHNEGRDFLHLWKITEAEAPHRITYTWEFEQYPGSGQVTFDLSEEGDSTKLTLTNSVAEDFPDDVPEFRRESCVGGWEYFIKGRAKRVSGKSVITGNLQPHPERSRTVTFARENRRRLPKNNQLTIDFLNVLTVLTDRTLKCARTFNQPEGGVTG